MRAAVLRRPGDVITVEDVEVPDLSADEVRVRVAYSGVCRSDYHVLAGDRPDAAMPVILGHEGAGVVEQVGAAVRHIRPGDRVVLSWKPYCRRCFYCVRGEPFLCQASGELTAGRTPFLLDGEPVARYAMLGTFAEVVVAHESAVVPVGDGIPLDRAALIGCAVTTGTGAVWNTARVPAGSTVLVIGCGGVGLSAVQAAAATGAARVLALDPQPAKRALARKLGATDVLDPADDDVAGLVAAATEGRGVDYAFEAIGLPAQIAAAVRLVRPGGTVVVVGQPADGATVPLDGYDLSDNAKQVIGCNYGSCRPTVDFPLLVNGYETGRLDLDSLVAGIRPLAEVNEAFEQLATGETARVLLQTDTTSTGDDIGD